MQTKFLKTNFHLPVSHRCQTRLRSKLCTLLWFCLCRSRENRGRLSLAGYPKLCVSDLDGSSKGHVCVKELWNYVQLDHISQWESGDRKSLLLCGFLLVGLRRFVNVRRNMTERMNKKTCSTERMNKKCSIVVKEAPIGPDQSERSRNFVHQSESSIEVMWPNWRHNAHIWS